ncbi:MAG: T9SS type A sorting domain-containing protein, partial [Bacteroidetes bacterium]|nr:T9SS type A sorting domain-containing protein [Bacteroidota bacterium]
NQILTSVNDQEIVAHKFKLYQNYPNPFNPVTRIKYAVSSTQNVKLKVFDLLGREVATLVNEPKQAGEYEIELDANKYGLTSGVYFYQLRAGEFISTKKFVYLR